ncbi:hypothetical protein IFM89_024203 [Coptis chinensis]|uniref:Uncharacterized protein n=1 Tax=Coptis chinensis TaxID=261450 RepID=A0A835H7M8_9MAGN|nr:hypothetical protein IFM89_024203 [Coptis chinensis]
METNAIPGITEIKDGCNPATWMLEVSAASIEIQLDVDFAEVYVNSTLYQRNQELIEELSTPASGSKEVYFPTELSQSFSTQCVGCFRKFVFLVNFVAYIPRGYKENTISDSLSQYNYVSEPYL